MDQLEPITLVLTRHEVEQALWCVEEQTKRIEIKASVRTNLAKKLAASLIGEEGDRG